MIEKRFINPIYYDYYYLYAVVCLNLRWILHKQSQRCWCSVPVLVHVHVHLYHAKIHLFQSCQGQQNVPCLDTVQSAYPSHTNWTLGIKRVFARYGMPKYCFILERQVHVKFQNNVRKYIRMCHPTVSCKTCEVADVLICITFWLFGWTKSSNIATEMETVFYLLWPRG